MGLRNTRSFNKFAARVCLTSMRLLKRIGLLANWEILGPPLLRSDNHYNRNHCRSEAFICVASLLKVVKELYRDWEVCMNFFLDFSDNPSPWFAPPEINGVIQTSIRCADSVPRVASSCFNKTCLFHLVHDPCETNDLSIQHPGLVSQLMDRLNFYYNSTVAPLANSNFDKAANPLGRNMFWEPWVTL